MLHRRAAWMSFCLWLTCAFGALTPSLPTIDQAFPQSATVGESVEMELEGNYLDSVQSIQILESEGLTASVIDSTFTRVRLRIASSRDARRGLYTLRLFTQRGASNVFHFRLTGWKSIYEQEPNDRETQATSVSTGLSVNGVLSNVDDSDFYSLHARAGETLAFNLLMGRNGYAGGAETGHFTLTLLNSRGVVLGSSFGRFLMDPYLQHRFAAEGDYYLVVNHSRMAVTCLENECNKRRLWEPYQLTVGRSPMLWSLWPNVARPGTTVEATLKADFLDPATPLLFSDANVSGKILNAGQDGYKVRIVVGANAKPGLHLLNVPDVSGTVAPLGFLVEGSPFQFEKEGNDSREASTPLEGPATIVGRIDHSGDVDSFQMAPTGSDALSFRLEARHLGSAMTDPNLSILCKEGDLAASNDDDPSFRNPKNRDSYIEFKAANAMCANREDGFYVQVRDSSKRFGDDRFYVLRVGHQAPAFVLGLRRDRLALERGKTNKVPVQVRRLEGFAGEVRVTAEELPSGIEAKALVVPAGQASAEMEWQVAAGAEIAPFPVKLAGTAEINGKKVTQNAVLPQSMLGDGPGYMQTGDSTAWASVVAPVQLALDRVPPPGAGFALDRHLLAMRGDRKVRVLVRIERTPDCTAPVTFAAEGLPEGVVLDSQRPAEDGKAAEIILKAQQDRVAAGEYRITLVGTMQAGGIEITEATKAFYLRVEQ